MIKHPAKYNDKFLPCFANLLQNSKSILDPFAGTGKIFLLEDYLPNAKIFATEIEPEWAGLHPKTIVADALRLPFADNSFDAICTSPTYSNRMSDHHNAKDGSQRNTYKHSLGRDLHPHNSGQMQWGDDYRKFHADAWLECKRVLVNGGIFVLNIKDHIRKGEIQKVTDWHIETLLRLGFGLDEHLKIAVSGNGMGQNGKARVEYESIFKFYLIK